MRHTRSTTRGLAVALGAALGAGTLLTSTLAGAATAQQPAAADRGAPAAAAAEDFVTGDELPAHPDGWYSQGPVDGLPEVPVFCYDTLLPAAGASHVAHWTELDATATQVVLELDSESAAADLAAVLDEASTRCAGDWLAANPGATASWDELGEVPGADYSRVFGVYTAPEEAGHDVNLFAVLRDGSTVTVVRWGQMGTLSQAPVTEFLDTAEAAFARISD
ncbi:hypothetical protein RM844_26405 [Streptomyces sp. DSM 44915]|uniref:Uncharacterized protein n=1 Tax=Streptomyces chisholmiae TaxID=3075540 RepID=A0ABU2JXU6_9ACTN|nr:hypothetical protein [Streptomyces sp. DSM 44915]MDT0269820.1 hypothetical protein [Streptomyces sp. DSM 44915]